MSLKDMYLDESYFLPWLIGPHFFFFDEKLRRGELPRLDYIKNNRRSLVTTQGDVDRLRQRLHRGEERRANDEDQISWRQT
jgi:hypothetical protein